MPREWRLISKPKPKVKRPKAAAKKPNSAAIRKKAAAKKPTKRITEPTVFKELRKWAADNGAIIHPSIAFLKDGKDHTVIAKEPIEAGTTLVSCPHNKAITVAKAHTEFYGKSTAKKRMAQLDGHELLCTYLVHHKEMAEKSPYHAYFATLPEKFTTPLYWNETDKKWLQGTDLLDATDEREHAWKEELENVNKTLPPGVKQIDWESYLWARTVLSSRSFPSKLLGVPDDQSMPMLLPVVDSLNHQPYCKITWEISQNNAISLIPEMKVKKDQVVWNNYGPKSNAELIMGYGFAQAFHNFDCLVIPNLVPDYERKYALMQKALKGCESLPTFEVVDGDVGWDDEAGKYLRIKSFIGLGSKPLKISFLRVQRIMHLRDPELDLVERHIKRVDWDFLSYRNELEMLTSLKYFIQPRYESIKLSAEQFHTPKNSRQEMMKNYRDGLQAIFEGITKDMNHRIFELGTAASSAFGSDDRPSHIPFIRFKRPVVNNVSQKQARPWVWTLDSLSKKSKLIEWVLDHDMWYPDSKGMYSSEMTDEALQLSLVYAAFGSPADKDFAGNVDIPHFRKFFAAVKDWRLDMSPQDEESVAELWEMVKEWTEDEEMKKFIKPELYTKERIKWAFSLYSHLSVANDDEGVGIVMV